MEKFTENLTEGLRRFAMAGVGAVTVTIDKSKEIFDLLADKGETAAAESQPAIDELQKKIAGQLDAFSKKLKADYENAGFEQLIARCMALTPEQKAILVEKLTAEPAAEEEQTEVSEENSSKESDEPAVCEEESSEESAAGPDLCADESAASEPPRSEEETAG